MELSIRAFAVLQNAISYAVDKHFEYIVPEMLLLMITRDEIFADAFSECGGDISLLAEDLGYYMDLYIERDESFKAPEMSAGMNAVMETAGRSAANSSVREICIRHIIHGIWNLDNSYAAYYMEKQNIMETDLLREMAYYEEDDDSADDSRQENDSDSDDDSDDAERKSEGKSSFAPCLNDALHDVNPLIGREEELERTIQILCRKDKNNPLHIGDPGVGKTALTYGLVSKIVSGDVPDELRGAKVFEIDLGGMIAGTQYRGDFEKRFKKVLSDIGKEEKPIIYIDEIHNLAGAGAVGSGSLDASNMLRPYLTDGHIRFIGATTFEEYKKYFEKSRSLVRRFQNVEIKEPDEEQTIRIINGLLPGYEKFHGVKYTEDAVRYAVSMSVKYISERFLPDKAIDLIDEAGAYCKLHADKEEERTVGKEIIDEILTKICRIPAETVKTDEVSGLKDLEKNLKSRVFGQDEAIAQVVNAVKFSKAGLLEEDKPLASLLFVGPTGVGKTEIARSLADELGVKLVRFDMSEYGEKHAVAKLIGSPAGYVGYEDGGLLTEAVRKTPSCVLLLDEIEKAHPDIYNILLQVMDYATLTDNQGRKADFRNVIVIMTSNAGASRLGKTGIGFNSTDNGGSVILDSVKQTFQPEFRNRLNRIVVFSKMDDEMGRKIIGRKLKELTQKLSARNIVFSADKKAEDLILAHGVSAEFGAREVDRVIRNDIKPLFVDEILFGGLRNGGTLCLSADGKEFFIEK